MNVILDAVLNNRGRVGRHFPMEMVFTRPPEFEMAVRFFGDTMSFDPHGIALPLATFLDESAARCPNATAVLDRHHTLDYRTLRSEAVRLAGALHKAGLRPGDRVMTLMANGTGFAVALWATQYVGAVFTPIHAETRRGKLAWLICDAEPFALLYDSALADAAIAALSSVDLPVVGFEVEGRHFRGLDLAAFGEAGEASAEPALPGPDDLAAIIYTSGSTGTPKGVMLTGRNMATAATSVSTYLGYAADERIFCAVPLTFDYGLHQLTMAARLGAAVIIERDLSNPPLALKRMAETRATALPLVPTMASVIIPFAARFPQNSLRIITNTAAALSEDLIDRLRAAFPAVRLFSMYGLTECHRCTFLDPDQLDRRKSSVGKAIPLTEMWVVDEDGIARRERAVGELVIRGATVMQGYWRNAEATLRRLKPGPLPGERVLHTGDLCRLDEEGNLYFLSRSDEVLKVKGEKVTPAEVERCLMRHPKVEAAAIVGQPDPVCGIRLVAFVQSAEMEVARHLRAFCADCLESHLRPARFVVMARLPLTANGKIDRQALAASLKPPNPAAFPSSNTLINTTQDVIG